MFYYVCDGLLFDSYQMAVNYANEQFRKFDVVLNVERVMKIDFGYTSEIVKV